jgi:Fur family zinc uptake transcriptional regulator
MILKGAASMADLNTVKQIIQAMTTKGWRITEQRKSMATLFADADGYLSPKDVYEHLRVQYPGVSFDTVYRNLRLLSEMGVLEQFYFNEGLKFRASCLKHHHHHLICVSCEKTLTFDYCPMNFISALPGNFDILNHRFEVFGTCPECANKAPDAQFNANNTTEKV